MRARKSASGILFFLLISSLRLRVSLFASLLFFFPSLSRLALFRVHIDLWHCALSSLLLTLFHIFWRFYFSTSKSISSGSKDIKEDGIFHFQNSKFNFVLTYSIIQTKRNIYWHRHNDPTTEVLFTHLANRRRKKFEKFSVGIDTKASYNFVERSLASVLFLQKQRTNICVISFFSVARLIIVYWPGLSSSILSSGLHRYFAWTRRFLNFLNGAFKFYEITVHFILLLSYSSAL